MDQNQALQKLFELVQGYLDSNPEKVVEYLPPQALKQHLSLDKSKREGDMEVLFSEIENYLKYAVNTGHPQCLNALWSGFSMPVFMGEVITALCNTSMYTYEVAPVATMLEKQVGDELLDIIGFPEGEIQMTTGGSNGNMLAMMIARNRAVEHCKTDGLSGTSSLVGFVSAESHYSYDKAANILGLGTDSLIKVPTNAAGQLKAEALETAIAQAEKEGKRPFFVGATAGTTLRGAFDELDETRAVAHKYKCWFHVDGAWGGPMIFASDREKYLKGLEKADSFVLDAHKIMGVTLICSFLALREPGHFAQTFQLGDASYIFHEQDYVDLGPLSVQCGRRNDILKFWLEWCYVGPSGFQKRMDQFLDLNAYARGLIEKNTHLELLSDDRDLCVCFRYQAEDIEDLNAFNIAVRQRLREQGVALVNYGYIGSTAVIRLVIANKDVQKSDIDEFFQNFITEAKKLHENY